MEGRRHASRRRGWQVGCCCLAPIPGPPARRADRLRSMQDGHSLEEASDATTAGRVFAALHEKTDRLKPRADLHGPVADRTFAVGDPYRGGRHPFRPLPDHTLRRGSLGQSQAGFPTLARRRAYASTREAVYGMKNATSTPCLCSVAFSQGQKAAFWGESNGRPDFVSLQRAARLGRVVRDHWCHSAPIHLVVCQEQNWYKISRFSRKQRRQHRGRAQCLPRI